MTNSILQTLLHTAQNAPYLFQPISSYVLNNQVHHTKGSFWLLNETTFLNTLDPAFHSLAGNKFWKLYGWINQPQAQNKHTIWASFGGAWSNHLHALALLGQYCHQATHGWVGTFDKTLYQTVPPAIAPAYTTLAALHKMGMSLAFLNPADYRQRYQLPFLHHLQQQHPHHLIIPEGGNGDSAEIGLKHWAMRIAHACTQHFGEQPIQLAVAAGTGTTLRFLRRHLPDSIHLFTQCAYRDKRLEQELSQLHPLITVLPNPITQTYALSSATWRAYVQAQLAYYDTQQLLLDPIYTLPLLHSMLPYLNPHKPSVLLHTGGLQGRLSLTTA